MFFWGKVGCNVPCFPPIDSNDFRFRALQSIRMVFDGNRQSDSKPAYRLHHCACGITGYLAGLSHGAVGVAAGFSIATLILIPPILFWSTRGTLISVTEILIVISRPLLAGLVGTGAALAASAGLNSFSGGPSPSTLCD